MKRIIILLGLLSLNLVVHAGINNYGVNATSLQVGVGARATGMGSAFVAVADDATASYWNPAGLGQMDLYLYGVGMQYVSLPNNAYSSYLSYAFQIPNTGSFSVAWNNFTIDGIKTRDITGQVTENITTAENIFYFSFGRKVYDWVKGLYLGATIKILQQGLADVNGIGHGLDIGAIWRPVLYWDHTIGINIQNIFQQVYWQSESKSIDKSPLNIKTGLALRFFSSDDVLYFYHLIATADVDYSKNSEFGYHAGIEYWPFEEIGVRTGLNNQEITAGASYKPKYYEVDYAFHYDLSDMGNHQHRVSLLLRL